MKNRYKKVFRTALVTLLLSLSLVGLSAVHSFAESQVLVRYFHSNIRCSTCLAFEDWSKTAAESFPQELASGKLKWQVINFDEPENKHYIKDYDLAEKSLVLSRIEDGKEVEWKNVEEFWDFDEGQKNEFVAFTKGLIEDYLKH